MNYDNKYLFFNKLKKSSWLESVSFEIWKIYIKWSTHKQKKLHYHNFYKVENDVNIIMICNERIQFFFQKS